MAVDILLFGHTGRLGQALSQQFGLRAVTVARSRIDFMDTRNLLSFMDMLPAQIKYVINCAAYNGMERCEQNPSTAFQINAQAPAILAEMCRKHKRTLIHFSSDYAICRDQSLLEARHEDMPRNPWGLYGHSKLMGELAIEQIGGSALIFRLSSIYSSDDMAGSLDVIRQLIAGRGTTDAPVFVLRQFTTMTSVRTVAKAIVHVVSVLSGTGGRIGSPRIYHLAAYNAQYKNAFARKAAMLFRNTDPVVEESTLALPRPHTSCLSSKKFQAAFGYELPSSDESLQEEYLYWKSQQSATVTA